jgi:hypothetical protein
VLIRSIERWLASQSMLEERSSGKERIRRIYVQEKK